MPRSKGNSTKKRDIVDAADMKAAVKAVIQGEMSLRCACKSFDVKKNTLHRQVQNFREKYGDAAVDKIEEYVYHSHYDVKRIFNEQEEESLVKYVQLVADMKYGLTKPKLRKLIYKYAVANNKNVFDGWHKDEMAGLQFMRSFTKRHPEISLRKPQATSLARATAFNRTNVEAFFANLDAAHKKYGPFAPQNIYNMDESGLTTVQDPPKVYAKTGQKQVGSITSAERGQLITVICAISAIGNHIPPFMIFPRVHFKDWMTKGAPPGTVGKANPSGWTNDDIFYSWLQHFINFTKPTRENRVLLVLDNHDSHLSQAALELARASGVVFLTLPPHTSHKLQPLDKTVYKSLKTFYNAALNSWLHNNPGKTFGIYDIPEVFGLIYGKAFTPDNIINGFRATGIHPYNPTIFTDEDFLCSSVTDRPAPSTANVSSDDSPVQVTSADQSTSSTSVSPEEVCPYPKAPPRVTTSNRGRKKGSTKIATVTPEKGPMDMDVGSNPDDLPGTSGTSKPKSLAKSLFPTEEDASSSDSDSEFSTQDSEDTEENFSDTSDEFGDEDNDEPVEIVDLANDDYVVVKLVYDENTKKQHDKYFIAKVTGIDKDEKTINVSFLKKKTDSSNFHFPAIPDIADVPIDSVMKKITAFTFRRGSFSLHEDLKYTFN